MSSESYSPPPFELRPYGRCAFLMERFSTERMKGLCDALEKSEDRPAGFVEYVIGFERLLLCFDRPVKVSDIHEWIEHLLEKSEAKPSVDAAVIRIPVVYDGVDLDYVCGETGLSREAVIERHSQPIYRVRMIGFTPGFPYLDGLDASLQLPRRASPRNRIAAGSVAIGGAHAGIYSVASPGGWHLLGRTDQQLFSADLAKVADVSARRVFALCAGDRVQFVPVNDFSETVSS